jgi:lipid A 3-O-deacylase
MITCHLIVNELIGCINKTITVLATALTLLSASAQAHADDTVFDELRFGASASVQDGNSHERGIFAEVSAFVVHS